jgi:hypothetical protein
MPYDLQLPKKLRKLWKVKIQDREALYEEPHVTIWCRDRRWRYSIRNRRFLDPKPDPSQVPDAIVELIGAQIEELTVQWNERFPQNPVAEEEKDDGEQNS